MKIMKAAMILASLIFFLSSAMAQNAGNIRGIIKSRNEKPVQGATVSLVRVRDSATVKIAAANNKGVFEFEQINNEKYFVSVTAAAHQKAFSNVIHINDQQQTIRLPDIILQPAVKSLADVTVTGRRPLIEQRIDRTIVNVDASITNTGTSALEVLEKSPGITVDRDGTISLKGKEGVQVMIDGRPTQLGGADLANLLRNMHSNQMDQIEIMTNPPARYDAAGNAGIINIKTKKTATAGYNGSVTAGYTQGRYPKTNEGFNVNYREGKTNLFSNLGHNYRKNFGVLRIQRKIFNDNTHELEKYFDQHGVRIGGGNSYNAKAGIDYFINKKTTVGIVLNGASSPSTSHNQNITSISNASKELENNTKAAVDHMSEWKSFNYNMNFRRLLNAKGKELTADVDFITYGSGNRQFMVNSYFDAAGHVSGKADTLQGLLPQNIHIYSGRMDYLHPLKKNARFEAGIKSSIVKTDNNAVYDSIQHGTTVHDFNRSNYFVYQENVNAAYINLSTPISEKLNAQLGLRLENTNAKGAQLTTGGKFVRAYTQLFPTAYFQYKVNKKNNVGLNFGRRIRRPNYESLNPFIRFIDRYTYSQGNPDLKPQFSNNIELIHTYADFLTTTLNFTATKDIIQSVIVQKGQEAYAMQANIASLTQFGIAISANKAVTRWWTNSINVNVLKNIYKGIVNSTPVSLGTTSFIINGTQQFKLSGTITAELSGRYRNGWLEGVVRAKPIGLIGAGLSKQVIKGKGTLRFTARDIFHTQKFRGIGKYGNADFEFQEVNDTQVAAIGFTYRFSKGKKIAPTKRTAGSAGEEQDRIGNQ